MLQTISTSTRIEQREEVGHSDEVGASYGAGPIHPKRAKLQHGPQSRHRYDAKAQAASTRDLSSRELSGKKNSERAGDQTTRKPVSVEIWGSGRDDAQSDGSGAAAGAGVAALRGAGGGGEADVWVVCGG